MPLMPWSRRLSTFAIASAVAACTVPPSRRCYRRGVTSRILGECLTNARGNYTHASAGRREFEIGTLPRRQLKFAGRFSDLCEIYDDRLAQIGKLRQLLRCVEGRALIAKLDVAHLAVRRLPAFVENDEAFHGPLLFLEARVVGRDALSC